MTSQVYYERHQSLAVIRINNPPVNALSHSVREGILHALEEALADDRISAIGLLCEGRTFIAGADIREFSQPPQAPSLPEVTNAIEASEKPVIALIHGTALGGGLEIALASHYRLATKGARFGMPEVNLGLIPGAGGTQRLPRLVGVPLAIEMIVHGRKIDAEQACASGLVDEILKGDSLLQSCLDLCPSLTNIGVAGRRVSVRSIPKPVEALACLEAEESRMRASGAKRQAPVQCLRAIRAAVEHVFAEGARVERELFLECKGSDEHLGLAHAFFAERRAIKIPELAHANPEPIRSVAVLGAGTMGRGIAISFLDAGFPVCLFDIDQAALEKGLNAISKHYDRSVTKGRLSREAADNRIHGLNSTLNYDALSDIDLIVEAAIESMQIKCAIFKELDRVCRPGAILASNTSTLDIDQIAASTGRAADVIGLHFFSPANIMRLLEVVTGTNTSNTTKATAMALAKSIGKVGVLVGNCYGFVGNRILYRRLPEAISLVTEGATPEQVDRVMTEFGFPMGQFAMSDLAGLDVGYRAREERRQSGEEVPRSWLDVLVEHGRLGQKSGAGVYRYEAGDRRPKEDEEALRLIAAFREAQGVVPRRVEDSEIRERCLYVMVNEAFKILDEGVARCESDIDVVWNCGYGFPADKGGLMYWARKEGLPFILERIRSLYGETGLEQWQPARGLLAAVDQAHFDATTSSTG